MDTKGATAMTIKAQWTCDWCGVQASIQLRRDRDCGVRIPEGWTPSFPTKETCEEANKRGDISDVICPECYKIQCDAVDEAKRWCMEKAKTAKTGKPAFRGAQ
jgi:hypothetical protein